MLLTYRAIIGTTSHISWCPYRDLLTYILINCNYKFSKSFRAFVTVWSRSQELFMPKGLAKHSQSSDSNFNCVSLAKHCSMCTVSPFTISCHETTTKVLLVRIHNIFCLRYASYAISELISDDSPTRNGYCAIRPLKYVAK